MLSYLSRRAASSTTRSLMSLICSPIWWCLATASILFIFPMNFLELLLLGGVGALDAHQEGVDDILHVVGQLPSVLGSDLDQLVELLLWHLADTTEGGLRSLELLCEELNVFPHSLVQPVLTVQHIDQIWKEGAKRSCRKLHDSRTLQICFVLIASLGLAATQLSAPWSALLLWVRMKGRVIIEERESRSC
jgi:hypothetical protein